MQKVANNHDLIIYVPDAPKLCWLKECCEQIKTKDKAFMEYVIVAVLVLLAAMLVWFVTHRIEGLKAEKRAGELCGEYEQRLAQQKVSYENELGSLKSAGEHALIEQKDAYEQKLNAQSFELASKDMELKAKDSSLAIVSESKSEQKSSYEKAIAEQKEAYERKFGELAAQNDKLISELKEQNAKALEEQRSRYEQTLAEVKDNQAKALAQMKENYEKTIAVNNENYAQTIREFKENQAKASEEQRKNYEATVAELKESQARTIEVTKNEMALQNEKLMKEREESLKKEAEETMRNITGALNKDINAMREKVEAQMKAHTEESTAIKTKFEETVNNLRSQTEKINTQAANLASALKGRNKMQGIFGETILANIFKQEGLEEGRDYESEFYLRDSKGNIIVNEESGKRMRPDFALHFPDNTDILVDSKVSLTALADYFAADTEEARKDASRRNFESVLNHIAELNGKEYQRYVKGRKTLDYVIMFIPNYGAYQLAKQENPNIFKEAFEKNVLITTEETLLPFLRLIRSAWIQKKTMDNVKDIMEGARKMLDRVAIFCTENAKLEASLEKVVNDFKTNTSRLVTGKQSIVRAANEVLGCGVALSSGKELPKASAAELPED